MAVRIQLRRGISSEWTAANPVLMEGEIGYETNTGYYKIGNGSTAWNSLSYQGLVGTVGLANLPASPTAGYALIYNGSALAWGQAGSPADEASSVIGTQVFS